MSDQAFSNPNPAFNPFPGLRPFRRDEDHLFFGRSQHTAELLRRLRETRFLAVVGSSGSGKSSLVRSGMIPALLGGTMARVGSDWEVALLRPGGDPMGNLAAALCEADLYDPDEEDMVDQVKATLGRSRLGLVEAARQSHLEEGTNLLIVVDQFEELFRFHHESPAGREQAPDFVERLLAASRQEEVPIYVVITMRSDFIGDCAQFSALPEAVAAGEYLVPRLNRDQCREVIEGPVGVARGTIAPRLVQRLVNDIGEDSDQLPVLQHALMRTWDEWARDHSQGEGLDLRHYRATGGMQGALSQHADEVYESLGDDRALTAKLFQVLTVRGADGRGTRRPTRMDRLVAILGDSEARVARVVDAFRAPGVTFLMPGLEHTLTASTVIDISHESLMRVWQRLRGWVEEEAQSARIFRRLAETGALWETGRAGLYHDPDLQIAQSWREEKAPNASWAELYGGCFEEAMAFLDQSHEAVAILEREKEEARQRELEQAQQLARAEQLRAEEQKRAAKRLRWLVAGSLMAAFAAFAAFFKAQRAEREAEVARESVRQEFTRSDVSLGHFFANQEDSDSVGRGIAHLARSLERDAQPDNPVAIDRIFNLLAYTVPPLYQSTPLAYAHSPIYDTVATPNGALIATAGLNSWLQIWSPESATPGQPVAEFTSGGTWHESLRFSPEFPRLIQGSTDGGFGGRLVDTSSWSVIRKMPQTRIHSVQVSEDGHRFFTASYGNPYLATWDAESGLLVDKLDLVSASRRPSLSPDERTLLLLGSESNSNDPVQQLVRTTGDPIAVPEDLSYDSVPARKVSVIAEFPVGERIDHSKTATFSPDGSRFLFRSSDGSIFIWSLEDQQEPEIELKGHSLEPVQEEDYYEKEKFEPFTVAAFSPDGQRVLSAGIDFTIRLWDASRGSEKSRSPLDEVEISKLVMREEPPTFSADGLRAMVATADGNCYYGAFNPNALDTLPEFKGPRPLTEGYAFLATNTVAIRPLLLPQTGVTCVSMPPGKSNIAALGTASGSVVLVDLVSGESIGGPFEHDGPIDRVVFSGEGSKIATRTKEGRLSIWERESTVRPLSSTLATDGELSAYQAYGIETNVLAASSGRALVVDGKRAEIRGLDGNTIGLQNGAPLTLAAFNPDTTWLATASKDPHSLRVRSVRSGDELLGSFNHPSGISSLALGPSQGEKPLMAAGFDDGNIDLWHLPSGDSADRPEIVGDHPCKSVVFSADGSMVAAVFQSGRDSYAQVWDPHTGHAITGRLNHGSVISMAAFVDDGQRLLVWPSDPVSGVAAVWDISLSGGQPAPDWFSDVATSFGGLRLDDESLLEPLEVRIMPPSSPQAAPRMTRFFEWLDEFPGTRSDSPFRPVASDAYVEALAAQTDLPLLDEAVRLRPRHARALARRGVVRSSSSRTDANAVLSTVDLTRARLLSPQDPEIQWYAAIDLEVRKQTESAEEAYARARQLGPLDLRAKLAVIELQRLCAGNLSEGPRREMLDQAILAATEARNERDLLVSRLQIERFELSCEYANFEAAVAEWEVIKEFDRFPDDRTAHSLLLKYLAAVEGEATRLKEAERWEDAIRMLQPIALLFELEKSFVELDTKTDDYWLPSTPLGRLIEWEKRDDPAVTMVAKDAVWSYRDDGSDQGTAWREIDFDDRQWDRGAAKLGYGADGERTVLSFGPDQDNKHITTYFRHAFNLTEDDLRSVLISNVVRDDGVIVYLNGVEVVRDNMPDGEVHYDTSGLNAGGNPTERREYSFSIDADLLIPGRNVLAAEIHQASATSTDIGFQLELLGRDYSVASHFTQMLSGDARELVKARAVALVPQLLRGNWQGVLDFDLSGDSMDVANLPTELPMAAMRIRGLRGNWEGVLDIADRLLDGSRDDSFLGRRLWFTGKEFALRRLGRDAEAEESRLASLAPERDPGLSERVVDLTNVYNCSLYDQEWHRGAPEDIADLAGSFEPHDGIRFDIRGAIILRGNNVNTNDYPSAITVPINQKAEAIHLLVGAVWGRAENNSEAVARLILHYADGGSKEEPLTYGDDVVDWWVSGSGSTVSRVAWRGSRPSDSRALSEKIWKNPNPDKEIDRLEIVSTMSGPGPLIIAVTLK